MAQNGYASEAGPYVEAMRTIRRAKSLFFGLLLAVLLLLITAFCLVRYVGVINSILRGLKEIPEREIFWDNLLSQVFPLLIFVGVVVGFLYGLTLLIGLGVSIAGRLEAVAGLTRGFFWSLFFLAIFLPWQNILVHRTANNQGVPMLKSVPGVLYGLDELKLKVAPAISDQQVDILREVWLGGRFLLYPIAALLLLVAAQSRYHPQRIEIPRPVTISRPTEKSPDKPQ
ncbi:MAG: hypothetical protein GWP14_01960 [Actinobacteria bacterium]|nr:hypothetical protein [Actinomycetota bacterium]